MAMLDSQRRPWKLCLVKYELDMFMISSEHIFKLEKDNILNTF